MSGNDSLDTQHQVLPKEVKYFCKHCDLTLKRKSIYKHHQEKHVGIKFTCQECGKEFTRKGSITSHTKSVHLGIKFQCQLCGYQATKKSNLTAHHREIHIGIKHTCQECRHQFTTKSDLTRHKKSVHRNIRYQCTYCDYQATPNGNLTSRVEKSGKHGEHAPGTSKVFPRNTQGKKCLEIAQFINISPLLPVA